VVQAVKGLPCRACGIPSTLASYRIFGCVACSQLETKPVQDATAGADPMWCPRCNP